MYVRKKKIKDWYYYYLVEGIREGKKVIQRHIKYLGKSGDISALKKYDIKEVMDKDGKKEFHIYANGRYFDTFPSDSGAKDYIKDMLQFEFLQSALLQNQTIQVDGFEEANNLLQTYLFRCDMNDEHRLSYNNYISNGYIEINDYLRSVDEEDAMLEYYSDIRKKVKHLDKLNNLFTAKKDLEVWRGASTKFLIGLKEGGSFTDNGFISTSLSESEADIFERGVVFNIKIKKGTTFGTGESNEKELILGRGHEFVVKKIVDKENKYYSSRRYQRLSTWYKYVELEMIN